MQVKDLMTPNPEVIHSAALLHEVADKMSKLGIGLLPVCKGDRVISVLSDRDITVRATAAGCDPTMSQVCDVMMTDVVYCFADQDIAEVAKLMETQQVRRQVTAQLGVHEIVVAAV